MRAVWVLVLLAGFAAGAQAQDFDTNRQWCWDETAGFERRIGACTWLLNSSRLTQSDYAEAFFKRGNTYYGNGQYDRSIIDFDQAIVLNSGLPGYYHNRGLAYQNKGKYDRANRDYDQAIALKPDLARAYASRAWVYAAMGKYDSAVRDYDQAIALEPDHADLYFNRGNAYGNKGQYNRAIRDYDEAIRLNPDDAEAIKIGSWLTN